MQDVHFMHVLQPFADLPYEEHRVEFCQVVIFINDAVKQLPSLHAEGRRESNSQPAACEEACCAHAPMSDLLLHDEDDVVARLEGGIQLDEVGVVQLVHYLDLVPHYLLRSKQTEKIQINIKRA